MWSLGVASYVFRTGKHLPGASPWTPSEPNREAKSWGVQSWARRRCGGTWSPCRLNDGEHEELRRQAGKARLRVPEFIRQRVLERRLQIGSPRQLGVAEFRELNRIGVNLNQIARALNQRREVSAPRLDELKRLRELIAHLLER